MKKTLSLLLLLALIIIPARAADVQDVKPTKNVILFISDGTSLSATQLQRLHAMFPASLARLDLYLLILFTAGMMIFIRQIRIELINRP